jgi:uncharacterized protein (DUF1684 family)
MPVTDSGAALVEAMRREKDQFFRQHPQSPLTPAQQERFSGLSYYDYDPALRLALQAEPAEGADHIRIETTTGEVRVYARAARITFVADGQPVSLVIYEAPFGYFLPFVDADAPLETYPAGRYVEPELLPDGRYLVDFNQAYNPTCAYNDGWSCPLTPAENRLPVSIRAGEKNPSGEWVALGHKG